MSEEADRIAALSVRNPGDIYLYDPLSQEEQLAHEDRIGGWEIQEITSTKNRIHVYYSRIISIYEATSTLSFGEASYREARLKGSFTLGRVDEGLLKAINQYRNIHVAGSGIVDNQVQIDLITEPSHICLADYLAASSAERYLQAQGFVSS